MVWSRILPLALLACSACYVDAYPVVVLGDGDDTGGFETSAGETGDGDPSPPPDIPEDPIPVPIEQCTVDPVSLDGPLPCELPESSDEFAPVIARLWHGDGAETSIVTTPLVANLDDDNGDGHVDVCDAPDIVVAAVALPIDKQSPWPAGHLHVVDGRDGDFYTIDIPIDAAINPALGDLDGDGIAEIVASQAAGPNSPYDLSARHLVAIRPSGELMWTGEAEFEGRGGSAIALADLDNDGEVEILAPAHVANASGELLWAPEDPATAYSMPVAVDLDLDGDLEVLYGGTAYDHSGAHLFDSDYVPRDRGAVAVADFDGDDLEPEIYIQHGGDHGVFAADGSLISACPTGGVMLDGGSHPVTIRDIDGDGSTDLIFSYAGEFHVLTVEDGVCEAKWSRKGDLEAGLSAGVSFDFLADGSAETIFTDLSHIKIFDSSGELAYQAPHQTRENIANPVIADVDGDGAAEILIVSSRPVGAEDIGERSALRILENADDRFAPTRRVWNQHTYHHSNIREDGRLPTVEQPHWQSENSFRANRGAEEVDVCIPPALFDNG